MEFQSYEMFRVSSSLVDAHLLMKVLNSSCHWLLMKLTDIILLYTASVVIILTSSHPNSCLIAGHFSAFAFF